LQHIQSPFLRQWLTQNGVSNGKILIKCPLLWRLAHTLASGQMLTNWDLSAIL